MRLIDADALKKAIIELDLDNTSHWTVIHKIDNAPTVDAISNDEGYEMYGKGYLQGYKRGKAEAIPKGEWINQFIGGNECVMCSECKLHFDIGTNYCPNCGADMRKGDES